MCSLLCNHFFVFPLSCCFELSFLHFVLFRDHRQFRSVTSFSISVSTWLRTLLFILREDGVIVSLFIFLKCVLCVDESADDLPCSIPTSTRPSTPPTACFEYDPHHTVDPTSNSHYYYKMIEHSMISSYDEDRRIFEQSFRSLARAFFQVFGQFSKNVL